MEKLIAQHIELDKEGVEVIIPDQQFRKRDVQFEGRKCHGGKGRFTVEDFEYDKEGNRYVGRMELNRNSGEKYQAKSSDCKRCALKETCIVSRGGEDEGEDRQNNIPGIAAVCGGYRENDRGEVYGLRVDEG